MKLRVLSVLLLALGIAAAVRPVVKAPEASACGGSEVADLGALEPVGAIVERMSTVGDDDWDTRDRAELRFLAPFEREHPRELEWLWGFSYGDSPGAVAPATKPAPAVVAVDPLDPVALDKALASRDPAAARAAADRYVAAWLAAPPAEVSDRKPALIKAASVIDPAAAKDLSAVEQALVQGIPNGWSADLKSRFTPADARALERKIDAWITKYPASPLAGYVTLWKVRTRFFSGEDAAAWEIVFAAPPALRTRALAEGRYLLLTGRPPNPAQLGALTDVAWIAAFTNGVIDDATFAKRWALAEAQPGRKAAVNLEERLLHGIATRPGTVKLPPSFPREPRVPSAFWAEMRAAALLRSGDSTGALDQLGKLPAKEPGRADLEASAHLAAKHPERAAQVEGLGADVREYIVAVLVATPDLERIAKGTGPLGVASRRELGLRTGTSGDFRKAATVIDKDDPMRAKSWRKVADLAAAKGARSGLELARYLDAKAGALFAQPDNDVYRALSYRHDPKARPAESRALELAMERRTERYQALVAYVDWLEKNPRDSEAKVALAEADATYNRLVNYASYDTLFWGRYLPKSDLAKRLRAAGKAVRGKP